ncbi:MAG: hypothetical protein KF857_03140 [Fimbriimonadaceae bacterium]|nr:hypothetical protein [Fimbriimonadaceae bacterium]
MSACAFSDHAETERFFTAVEGVYEACVWARGETLLARLLVDENATMSCQDLKQACALALGESRTPSLMLIERVGRLCREQSA